MLPSPLVRLVSHVPITHRNHHPRPPPRALDLSDHEALGEAGERELLRSYRCPELLDGDPYFEFPPHVVRLEWTVCFTHAPGL